MISSLEHLKKLDDRLRYVVSRSGYALDQKIPVAVNGDPRDFDEIATAIHDHGGTVRHVLKLARAVSAWLPIGGVEALAQFHAVHSIELDEQMHIA